MSQPPFCSLPPSRVQEQPDKSGRKWERRGAETKHCVRCCLPYRQSNGMGTNSHVLQHCVSWCQWDPSTSQPTGSRDVPCCCCRDSMEDRNRKKLRASLMLSQLGDGLSYPCFGRDKVSVLTSRAALYLTVHLPSLQWVSGVQKTFEHDHIFLKPVCNGKTHRVDHTDPVGFSMSCCLCDKTDFLSQVFQHPAGLKPLVGRRCDPTVTVLLQSLGDPWPF